MSLRVLAVAALLLSSVVVVIQGTVVYQVPCNYTTPSCECPVFNDYGEPIDICSFSLTVTLQYTFFRYQMDGTTKFTAQVYVIDENGQERPNFCSGCGGADCSSGLCTEAFMVDGYTFRSYIAVNNRIPGPTIIVNHNQSVMANVTNNIFDDISIHWHGIHQIKTNWMDGVHQVTQCGIPP